MAPLFWHLNSVIFEYDRLSGASICLFMSVIYVGSLYLGTSSKYGRDNPSVIKLRFVRVFLVCLCLFPFLWLCSTKSHNVMARPLYVWVGIRFQGFFVSLILPLLLTMVLFAGPLTLHYLDGVFKIYKDPNYWLNCFKNLIWVRNHIVAPFTEELTFRACMLPYLVPSFGEHAAVFVCPMFFGVAHFHHMIEKIKTGLDVKTAVLQALFQFSYTTIFGAYSAFLFLRTNNIMAPVVVHAFCNHMGFPNFQEVFAYEKPLRWKIMGSFVAGLVGWYVLLYPLTNPALYNNTFYSL